jgi:hypothetical protein
MSTPAWCSATTSIFLLQVPGGAVDQGAMWIHGGEAGNAVYDAAVEANLTLSPIQNYGSLTLFDAQGARSSPASYLRAYTQLNSRVSTPTVSPSAASLKQCRRYRLAEPTFPLVLHAADPPDGRPTGNSRRARHLPGCRVFGLPGQRHTQPTASGASQRNVSGWQGGLHQMRWAACHSLAWRSQTCLLVGGA